MANWMPNCKNLKKCMVVARPNVLRYPRWQKLDPQFQILHEDGPGAWQLVCKIWGHWPKVFGCSKTKCPKMSKNAKFCTPNIMTLSSNFEFLSIWTIENFFTSENMLMGNKF